MNKRGGDEPKTVSVVTLIGQEVAKACQRLNSRVVPRGFASMNSRPSVAEMRYLLEQYNLGMNSELSGERKCRMWFGKRLSHTLQRAQVEYSKIVEWL